MSRRSSRRPSSAPSSGTCSPGGSASRRSSATRSSAGCSARCASPAGCRRWHGAGVVNKVLLPLVGSPIVGLRHRLRADGAHHEVFRRANPRRMNDRFRRLQILVRGLHGVQPRQQRRAEDDGHHHPGPRRRPASSRVQGPPLGDPPAATAIGLGTAAGGWRIIRTMGSKMVKLDPVHGFAAETTAASIIFTASHLGMPVSTTHVITSAILGVGVDRPPVGGALGRRAQHRHGVDPHPPRGGPDGRARLPGAAPLHLGAALPAARACA